MKRRCEGTKEKNFGGYAAEPLPEKPKKEMKGNPRRGTLQGKHSSKKESLKAKVHDESLPEEKRAEAKESLRKDRKRKEEKYKKSLEASALADPYRWICNVCESDEGTDSVNQHYRENCFKCSRPRPSRDAEKACPRMFLERWVCKECGDIGKTYNAETS